MNLERTLNIIFQWCIAPPQVWRENDFLKFFEGLIRQGIAEGSLRAEIDAKQTSYLLVAFYMGFMLQAALYRDSLNWTELSGYGLRQIFAGLGSVK